MYHLKYFILITAIALVATACGGPGPAACDDERFTTAVWNDLQDHLVEDTPAITSYEDVELLDVNPRTTREGETDMRCAVKYTVNRKFDSRPDRELELPDVRYKIWLEDDQWWYQVTQW